MPDTDPTLCLGSITGPLLIFGGPYSNLQALESLRITAEQLNIPPENCLCTGDIVAYCAQPKETVAAIRAWGIHCLMGNCEESFANNTQDCGCGFEEGTQCDLLSAQWFNFANQQLGQSEREWFADLPRSIRFDLHGISAQVVHGSPSSINRFIFNSTPEEIFREELALTQADMIIGGHCGIPFTKRVDKKIWHNAGAIGMPANDGNTYTWFSVIDVKQGVLTIELHKLDYDHHTAHQTMLQEGMNNGYAEALTSGLWPSMDVLPPEERNQRGTDIKTSPLHLDLLGQRA